MLGVFVGAFLVDLMSRGRTGWFARAQRRAAMAADDFKRRVGSTAHDFRAAFAEGYGRAG